MKRKYKFMICTVFILCTLTLFIPISIFAGGGAAIEKPEYQERPTLTTSLFKSDQDVLSDEAISKILSSKFELPQKVAIAPVHTIKPEEVIDEQATSNDHESLQEEDIDVLVASNDLKILPEEVIDEQEADNHLEIINDSDHGCAGNNYEK